ncbi:MAG TPA: cation:proton antiporter [Gaiellaceae bacterium]|nr:cation:proton antiporter [Gaiellaceae bacterium]
MSFGVLFVIVLAGLAGPLLGAGRHVLVPVVVGELLAGLLLGRSGFRWLHPDQPTFAFLAEIGFAMVMFTAGMNVPLREPALVRQIRRGALAAGTAGVLAVGAGWLVTRLAGLGHPAIYAVVLASGSAAALVPALEEVGLLDDTTALVVAAQVAIADVASIVVVPLVLRPHRALHAVLGIALVAAGCVALLVALRFLHTRGWIRELRQRSKSRAWALDLRLSLLVLFGLAWITVRAGVSVLVAGFGVGLVVAATGGPKRLSRQVTGIAQGFFVPLFFVALGARIDVREFVHRGSLIELGVLLVVLNIGIHAVSALVTRQPLAAGLAATVQLGVPAAVVALGLQDRLLSAGAAAAIMVAALASLAVSTVGVAMLAARAPRSATAASAAP